MFIKVSSDIEKYVKISTFNIISIDNDGEILMYTRSNRYQHKAGWSDLMADIGERELDKFVAFSDKSHGYYVRLSAIKEFYDSPISNGKTRCYVKISGWSVYIDKKANYIKELIDAKLVGKAGNKKGR